MDYPAINGQPVTERHTRLCAEKGHATHTANGVDTDICPRCGDVKDTMDTSELFAGYITRVSHPEPIDGDDRGFWSVEVEDLETGEIHARQYLAYNRVTAPEGIDAASAALDLLSIVTTGEGLA